MLKLVKNTEVVTRLESLQNDNNKEVIQGILPIVKELGTDLFEVEVPDKTAFTLVENAKTGDFMRVCKEVIVNKVMHIVRIDMKVSAISPRGIKLGNKILMPALVEQATRYQNDTKEVPGRTYVTKAGIKVQGSTKGLKYFLGYKQGYATAGGYSVKIVVPDVGTKSAGTADTTAFDIDF